MEELNQSRFIYSENKEKPFMRVFPTKHKKFYYTNKLQKDEIIEKGSMLYIKPCFPNKFIPNPHFRIFIASISE